MWGGGTAKQTERKCQKKGGHVAVSKGLKLEQSRVQLSFRQEHSTEGFIVICNYVVFLWGLSLVCSHTEALFSQGILSRRTERGWDHGHC